MPIGGAPRDAAISGGPAKAEGVEVAVEGVIGWDALIKVLYVLVHVPQRASSTAVVFD